MKRTSMQDLINAAIECFGCKDMAYSWWTSKNTQLEGKSPFEVTKEGKGHKAMKILYRLGLREVG
ncbi:MAG: hypothetical protein KGJ07_00170 [Patescibacteria group bacterium]|nr:hypothetical protein [Patescibacteria group bacterium]